MAGKKKPAKAPKAAVKTVPKAKGKGKKGK